MHQAPSPQSKISHRAFPISTEKISSCSRRSARSIQSLTSSIAATHSGKLSKPAAPSVHLLRTSSIPPSPDKLPLKQMTTDERLAADYSGTGLTCGPHPIAYHRQHLRAQGYRSADDLSHCDNNSFVRIAGCVIARQRPGTAKGFVFLSMEDETGIANIIITPDLFERDRVTITRTRFLDIEGTLQFSAA